MAPSSDTPDSSVTAAGVAIVGAGLMGAGIAREALRAGLEVTLCDVDEVALERVRTTLPSSVDPALLRTTTSLDDLAASTTVIEAVPEDRELKIAILTRLGGVLPATAIVASNTSSIPIADLADAFGDPERVVGMHFFSPVASMKLVELIATPASSPGSLEQARTLAERLGKQVVASPDESGFIVNKLLVPYLLSAMRMLERGRAAAEDIDAAMELGCGHPMGPLRLADFIGLDVVLAIAHELHDSTGEAADEPPAILDEMVAGGRLGRKTGSGFYDY